ncbi:translation elongation factor Ts [Mycoplasma sp. SG1]|uniref:translation elongation factor Ts n=1 Tax=Mycoplasma sp. SG1 TaxID=2810348 RepID=UPI0020247F13|nr:translation elongation factor Ts [Mycoplasma sp. SG1]URM53233.1 translation elongation factor Ts [Mycoplasma sp. SG1]
MNLDLIKKLREITNVGYAECVKALKATKNDIDEAIKWIRLYSSHKIIKKSGNLNKEGNVLSAFKDNVGYILVLNSETDFVSNTEMFQNLHKKLIETALEQKPDDLKTFENIKVADNGSVKDYILETAAKFKENISISSFKKLSLKENQWFWSYNHINKLSSSLVIFEGDKNPETADDICMQIVASKPKYLSIESVPQEIIDAEKEIVSQEIAKNKTNRPASIVEKIIAGKMNRFYTENCLLEQPFIKLSKQTVKQYLANHNLKVVDFLFQEIVK